MIVDRQRLHYEKGVLIEDLWQKDKKHLKPLPISDLPIYTIESLKVNKYGEIRLDGGKFVIHKARIKQALIIKKEWNRFSCITKGGEVIYEEFRSYMHESRTIPGTIYLKIGRENRVLLGIQDSSNTYRIMSKPI